MHIDWIIDNLAAWFYSNYTQNSSFLSIFAPYNTQPCYINQCVPKCLLLLSLKATQTNFKNTHPYVMAVRQKRKRETGEEEKLALSLSFSGG